MNSQNSRLILRLTPFLNKIPIVCLLLFLIILPLSWFRNSDAFLFIHDQYLPLNAHEIIKNLFIWNSDQLGDAMAYLKFLSFMPEGLIYLILYKTGVSVQIAEKIIFSILFSLPGLSMYLLLKRVIAFHKDIKNILNVECASVVGALFYSFNMYLVIIWHCMTSTFGYAVLPLIVKWLWEIFVEKRSVLRRVLWIGLISSLGVSSFVGIVGYLLMPMTIFWFVGIIYFGREHRKEWVAKGIMIGGVVLIFVLLWLLPVLLSYWTSPAIYANANANVSLNFIGLTLSKGGILQQLRLLASWAWGYEWGGRLFFSFSEIYEKNIFLIFLTIFFPVFSFVALFKREKNFFVIYAALLVVIFAFLAKGIQPPWGEAFEWMFKHIPMFNIFRSPDTKFSPNIAFGISILLGFSTYLTFGCLRRIWIRILVMSLFLCSILTCSWPLVTGSTVLEGNQGNISGRSIKIPNFYYDASNYINGDQEDFKVAFFPSCSWASYVWDKGKGHVGQDIFRKLLHHSVIGSPEENVSFQNAGILLNCLYTGNFLDLLPLMNVRYVVIRKDLLLSRARQSEESVNLKKLVKRLEVISENKKTFGSLEVYKLKYDFYFPKIYPASVEAPVIPLNSFIPWIHTQQLKHDMFIPSLCIDREVLENLSWPSKNILLGILDQSGFILIHDSVKAFLIRLSGKIFPVSRNTQHPQSKVSSVFFADSYDLKGKLKSGSLLEKNIKTQWILWDWNWICELAKKAHYDLLQLNPTIFKDGKTLLKKMRHWGYVFLSLNENLKQEKEFFIKEEGFYHLYAGYSSQIYFKRLEHKFFKTLLVPVFLSPGFECEDISQNMNISGYGCSFRSFLKKGCLNIKVFFNGDDDQFLKIKYSPLLKHVNKDKHASRREYIDLYKHPFLALTYSVQDPSVQTIQVTFRVSTSHHEAQQFLIPRGSCPIYASRKKATFIVDLLRAAQRVLPGRKHYYLDSLEILPHKIWGVNCVKKKQKDYLFKIYSLNLLKRLPVQIQEDTSFEGRDKNFYVYSSKEGNQIVETLKKIPIDKKFYFRVKENRFDLTHFHSLGFILREYPYDRVKVILGLRSLKGEAEKLLEDIFITIPMNEKNKKVHLNLRKILTEKKIDPASYELSWIEWMPPHQKKASWKYDVQVCWYETYRSILKRKVFKQEEFHPVVLDGSPVQWIKKENEENLQVKSEDLKLNVGKHRLQFFKMKETKLDWLMVLPNLEEIKKKLPQVSFRKINPTRYEVNVCGANGPFWLIFSDSFHPSWRAYMYDPLRSRSLLNVSKSIIGNSQGWFVEKKELPLHIKANVFANGWWVDPKSLGVKFKRIGDQYEYDQFQLMIEFSQQKWFEWGLLISLSLIFIICPCGGLILYIKRGKVHEEN